MNAQIETRGSELAMKRLTKHELPRPGKDVQLVVQPRRPTHSLWDRLGRVVEGANEDGVEADAFRYLPQILDCHGEKVRSLKVPACRREAPVNWLPAARYPAEKRQSAVRFNGEVGVRQLSYQDAGRS